MTDVSVRELRNQGGKVLDRVAAGEEFIVTRDGTAIALLSPLPHRTTDATTLLARWRHLPKVDTVAFRRDIDDLMDPSL